MKWFIRIFIGGGLLWFGSLSLLALYAEFGLPWKYGQKQDIIEHYLEEKYKDSFTFERMRYDFLHGRNYYTYVTAASTGVSFYVEVSPEQVVEDAYSDKYWGEYVKNLFRPILAATLSQYDGLYGEVFLAKPMDLQTFDVEAASFSLHVTIHMPLSEGNAEAQCNQWFAAIQKIRAAGYSMQRLSIDYYGQEIILEAQPLQEIQSAEQLYSFFHLEK